MIDTAEMKTSFKTLYDPLSGADFCVDTMTRRGYRRPPGWAPAAGPGPPPAGPAWTAVIRARPEHEDWMLFSTTVRKQDMQAESMSGVLKLQVNVGLMIDLCRVSWVLESIRLIVVDTRQFSFDVTRFTSQAEIWETVVECLSYQDMIRLYRCCRELQHIFGEDLLWLINLKVSWLHGTVAFSLYETLNPATY